MTKYSIKGGLESAIKRALGKSGGGLPWLNLLSIGSLNILTKIIGMLSAVWLARCLTPQQLGVVSFGLACQIPIQRLLSLGVGPILVAATRDYNSDDAKAVFRFYHLLRAQLAWLCLMVWCGSFGLVYVFGDRMLGLVGLFLAPCIITGSVSYVAAAQRFNKLNQTTLLELLNLSLVSAGVLLLINEGEDAASAAKIYAICGILGVVVSMIWAKSLLGAGRGPRDRSVFRSTIAPAQFLWPLLITVSTYGYTALELPLVGWLYGFDDAGLYRVAGTIPGVIMLLVSTFSSVMYPRYVEWARSPSMLLSRLRKLSKWVLAFCFVSAIILIVFGADVLVFIFGRQYIGAYGYLVLIGAAKLSILWVNVWSVPLLALREERYVGILTLCVSLGCVLLNFLSASMWGSGLAVALLSLTSEIVVGFFCWRRLTVKCKEFSNI